MAHDIFISYAHEDKLLADALCATLERNGLRCWIAPRDVPPGNWGAAIVEAIEASRALVLVFSSRSNTSPQVHREVERAVSKGLIVVPVRVQDVPLSKEMQYFISSQHWLDALTPPVEQQFETVSGKLQLWLHKGRDSAPADRSDVVAASGLAKSHGSKLSKYVAALLCLIAAGLGGAIFLKKKTLVPLAPIFQVQLQDKESKEGSAANFEGLVEGAGRLSFRWEFSDGQGKWAQIPEAHDNKLHLDAVKPSQAGHYRLVASNQGGSVTSAPAKLRVVPLRPPEIARAPANRELRRGERAELKFEAAGDGTLQYTWQSEKEGDSWEPISKQDTDTLVIESVNESKRYRLIASSMVGSVTSSPVSVKVILPQKPGFSRQPPGAEALAGADAVIEAVATGDEPLSYSWEYKGDKDTTWTPVPNASSGRLVLAHAKKSNAGSYRLTVQNREGSVTSAEAVLKVRPVKPPLTIALDRNQGLHVGKVDFGQKLVAGLQQQLLASDKFDVRVETVYRNSRGPSTSGTYKLLLSVEQFELAVTDKTPRASSIIGRIVTVNSQSLFPSTFEPRIDYRIPWQILAGDSLLKADKASGSAVGNTFQMQHRQNQTIPETQAKNFALSNDLVPASAAIEQAISIIAQQVSAVDLPD